MLEISAREKQVLLYGVRLCCVYIGDILETRAGAMVEELHFQQ